MWFTAHGHNFGFWIGNATRLVFFTADTVNDMPFRHLDIGFGHGANNVDLVIFPWQVAGIDIYDVIGVIKSKHRVGPIPMNVMNFSGLDLFKAAEKHHQKKCNKSTRTTHFRLHVVVISSEA